MWPWGHLAVGYLLYTGLHRYRSRRGPSGPAALAVAFGTQFPDLVDKPLAWTFAVLPSGRSLAHSWLIAGILLLVGWQALGTRRRALLVPFGLGWLSHGIGDGAYSVVTWEPAYLGFLLWPVTSTPPYELDQSFVAHLLAFQWDASMFVQTGLFVVATVVWVLDGRPGLETIRVSVESAVDVVRG